MTTILRTIKRSTIAIDASSNASSALGFPPMRADGLTAQNAAIVCAFQCDIERAGNCDYDALRAALQWARSNPTQVSTYTLSVRYNDAIYAAFGIGRIG